MKVNKTLKKNYKKMSEFEVGDIDLRLDLSEEIELLKAQIKEQEDRKKGLEEKAKSILFGITLAITAMTFSLNYERIAWNTLLDIISNSFLMLSIICVTWSGVFVVKILIPQPFHNFYVQIDTNIEQKTFTLQKQPSVDLLKDLIYFKAMNDNINLRIANNTYVALTLMRNGIILFACYFVTAFAIKNIIPKSAPVMQNKIEIKINDSTSAEIPLRFELQTNAKNFKISTDSIRIINKTIPLGVSKK